MYTHKETYGGPYSPNWSRDTPQINAYTPDRRNALYPMHSSCDNGTISGRVSGYALFRIPIHRHLQLASHPRGIRVRTGITGNPHWKLPALRPTPYRIPGSLSMLRHFIAEWTVGFVFNRERFMPQASGRPWCSTNASQPYLLISDTSCDTQNLRSLTRQSSYYNNKISSCA